LSLASVVDDFPLFERREEKERFLLALGLLASRSITLARAAELSGMSRLEFSAVLRSMGFKYSYLDEGEALKELGAAEELAEKRAH